MVIPALEERFVTDGQGNRVAVILSLGEYQQLLEAIEELADLRAFDEAQASREEAVPFEQAIREIEQGRS